MHLAGSGARSFHLDVQCSSFRVPLTSFSVIQLGSGVGTAPYVRILRPFSTKMKKEQERGSPVSWWC